MGMCSPPEKKGAWKINVLSFLVHPVSFQISGELRFFCFSDVFMAGGLEVTRILSKKIYQWRLGTGNWRLGTGHSKLYHNCCLKSPHY